MEEKALFLDRDGIIVKPIKGEAPQNPKQLQIMPAIIPVIKRARSLGHLIIIVSNQPDIALGKISEETKSALERKFIKLLKDYRIKADAIYYCFHHPKGINPKYTQDCDCQKPKPGMILQAIKKFNIDPSQSFILGDRASDIRAGELAGVQTVLFDPKNTQKQFLELLTVKPNYRINDLKKILNLMNYSEASFGVSLRESSYVSHSTPQQTARHSGSIINQKQAFILAAGEGKRMKSLTKTTPKPLVKINGKPILDYVLTLLKIHNFNRIGINLFYLSKIMENYLSKLKMEIQYVKEKHLSGTAGGILSISKITKPSSPFLVISADMMVNFDLTRIYDFHLKHKGIATICCYFRPKSKLVPQKSGQLVFDRKTKKILQIYERFSEIKSRWVNSSVYVFNPEVLDFIPKQGFFDVAKDLIPYLLKSKKNVYAYPINRRRFYQLGIDTPDRVKQVEEDIKSGKFKL